MEHNHNEYFKKDFIKKSLEKDDDFQIVSRIFSLLSEPTRLKIFWLLCHSKECVVTIAEYMDMTTPAVSHHLKLLKEAEVIDFYRDGKEVFYSAAKNSNVKLLHNIIEEIMSVSCPDFDDEHEKINENTEYQENHVTTIKKLHDYLTGNLSSRITIDELAKKYAMNPTTLKTVFKDVYGKSLAAHIKEHRMEKAAELLSTTELSISEISGMVGYENQSKFSAVFKDFYGETPVEYRKNHG